MRKTLSILICLMITLIIVGCARKPGSTSVDPYEKFNRGVFAFNQDIDHLIYRPVAKVYRAVIPHILRKGIANVFDNIDVLTTLPNDLLQGKIRYVFADFWRFFINTTFGIGGLFDVASHVGIPKHYEDFGMTLAYWSGGTRSPYLVIPLLGPSTFRTAFSLPFDYVMSPWLYIQPRSIGFWAYVIKYAGIRVQLLDTDKLVDDAFDPYIFVRNAYLQRRNRQININMKPYRSPAERAKENGQLERSPSLYRAAERKLPKPSKTYATHRPLPTRDSAKYG